VRKADPLFIATVCVQWLVTAGVALAAHRTGSIYGTDASARAVAGAAKRLADGTLPHTGGPGYPVLLTPLALLTHSANTFAAVVTTLSVAVLAPVASYCLLDLAKNIAGRPYAVLAAAVWLVGPVAAVPLFVTKYHDAYVDNVLPALYGLTLHPAYLAMVLSLAAATFALRATAGAPGAAFTAGLLAALATAVLPVAAAVAVGSALALAAARRWRGLLEGSAGLAAGLAPTLLWRERALGSVDLTLGHPSWGRFDAAMANVREFFWSNRLLQWLPVAGTVGVLRLTRPAAALLAGWLGAFVIVVVATPSDFTDGRIFIDLIPSWPAYALLAASVPALVPRLTSRYHSRSRLGAPPAHSGG
jgi:hypothetical protein